MMNGTRFNWRLALAHLLVVLGFYGGLIVMLLMVWDNWRAGVAALAALCVMQSVWVYMSLKKS
jgi:hypothetical protein